MNVTVLVNRAPVTTKGDTIEDILEQCGYTIEGVIVLREGSVILEEEVSDGDTIELVPVASGG